MLILLGNASFVPLIKTQLVAAQQYRVNEYQTKNNQ